MSEVKKVIVFWEGLPACALLLSSLARNPEVHLTVFATRAAVPFHDIDKRLDCNVIYLAYSSEILGYQWLFKDCTAFVFTGWRHRSVLELATQLRKKFNTKSVMAVDNRFKNNARQMLGAIYFRLFLRGKVDYAFVPGKSANRLMRFFGLRQNQIKLGYYGAASQIYWSDVEWKDRTNEFLFVGSVDRRKGVDQLIEGYKIYRRQGGSWSLRMVGEGPLRDGYEGLDGVAWDGFRQPPEVAERMRKSKVLFLTSRDDNWGTVVCEAAACGMLLAVSCKSGAVEDCIMEGVNGVSIETVTAKKIASTMWRFENQQHRNSEYGSSISKLIAQQFGERTYENSLCSIINDN